MGIDFTFGYFTAVEFLASEVRNLLADAEANRSYYLAECMGRSAGWLAYGVAIAGEASLVISVEDITGKYETSEETVNPKTGPEGNPPRHGPDEVVKRIVATMRVREEAEGKEFGVIVMAEGLAELLPYEHIEGVPRDEHGHIAVAKLSLGRLFADLVGQGIHPADRQEAEDHRLADSATRAAAPGRRPSTSCWAASSASAPTGAGREAAGRRDGLGLRPVGVELRAVQPIGRSGHAGDGGPLHRARLRLPPPGAVFGNVRQRLRRGKSPLPPGEG